MISADRITLARHTDDRCVFHVELTGELEPGVCWATETAVVEGGFDPWPETDEADVRLRQRVAEIINGRVDLVGAEAFAELMARGGREISTELRSTR